MRYVNYKFVHLLQTASIAVLLFSAGLAQAEFRQFEISIEEKEIEIAPGLTSKVWAYNGQVPGPLIHVQEGDDVEVTLVNNTSLSHTIHWHGVYQTNSWHSDGVPGVSQAATQPGESFVYRFIADKPGSLWYHCHVNVPEHVGLRGMWGPLIVDPKNPIAIEKEVTKEAILMFTSWNSKVAQNFGKGGHPTEEMDYFSINGKSFPLTQPLRVKEGDVLRLRLFGAGTETAFHLHGHDMLVTHKDGLPLETPYWADVIDVPMGARIDAIVRMNNPGIWINHDHIEHHTSNNGKTPGGAVMIVEYEGVETDEWYVWKDKDATYEPDFYMSESMKKGYGLHNIPAFKGTDIKAERKTKKKKKQDS
jgi:FtsP/CotA-like multicopper oxidase with cupredoxin domain